MRQAHMALLLLSTFLCVTTARAEDKFSDRWYPQSDRDIKFGGSRQVPVPGQAASAGSENARVAASPAVLAGVFMRMSEELKYKGPWAFQDAKSPVGDFLKKEFAGLKVQVPALASRDYFKSKAQKGGPVDQVNAFLEREGFTIRLEPSTDATAIAVGVTMRIGVKWTTKGTSVPLKLDDGGQVAGALVPDAQFFTSQAATSREPVVMLTTESGEKVYMVRYGKDLSPDSVSAYVAARDLAKGLSPDTSGTYAGVHFPKTDFDSASAGDDGSVALKDVCTTDRFCIEQFKMQYIFKMNHIGALVKVAGASLGTTRSMRGPTPYQIAGPFLIWVDVDGAIPFAALITKPSMKDPGDDLK